jgi:hypothetical protein
MNHNKIYDIFLKKIEYDEWLNVTQKVNDNNNLRSEGINTKVFMSQISKKKIGALGPVEAG